MIQEICIRIRSQLFFYIDNELKEDKKVELISHLDSCPDCKKFYDVEKNIKAKICDKLKDAYFCKCDVEKLKSIILVRISNIRDL